MSENKEEKSKQLTRIVCEFCVRGHMTLFNFYNGLLRRNIVVPILWISSDSVGEFHVTCPRSYRYLVAELKFELGQFCV